MKPVLLFVLSICLLTACRKNNSDTAYCPTKCRTLPYSVIFAYEFSLEDVDTVYVRKFAASFSTLLSDTLYTLADTAHYFVNQGGNWANVGFGFKGLKIQPGDEFEIEIPATGHLFRISEVVEADITSLLDCSLPVKACSVAPGSITVSGGKYARENFEPQPLLRLQK
jgi:hypothetical protein